MSSIDYTEELGFSEDDLKEPEDILFTAKQPVTMQIVSYKDVDRKATANKKEFKMLFVTVKVLDGDNAGKLFDLKINKKFKETYLKFLRCFWTVKELTEAIGAGVLSDKVRMIGATIEVLPAPPKTIGDKTYQNFWEFKKVAKTEPTTEKKVVDFS